MDAPTSIVVSIATAGRSNSIIPETTRLTLVSKIKNAKSITAHTIMSKMIVATQLI